jgi:hypothetical protein
MGMAKMASSSKESVTAMPTQRLVYNVQLSVSVGLVWMVCQLTKFSHVLPYSFHG